MNLALIALIIAIPVFFYATNVEARRRLLSPINTFWLVYLDFGVLQSWPNESQWIAHYGRDAYLKTLFLFLIVGIAVIAGHSFSAGRRLAHRLPVIGYEDVPGRYNFVAWLWIGAGTLGYMHFASAVGGWANFLSVSRLNIDYSEASGYALNLLFLLPVGIVILLCSVFDGKASPAMKAGALILTATYGLFVVYQGSRSGIISLAVLTIGAVYGRRRRFPVSAIVFCFVVVILAVGFIREYRDTFYNGTVNTSASVPDIISHSLLSYFNRTETEDVQLGSEFGMTIAAAYWIPDSIPYNYGEMFLEMLTRPIPRSIWPAKRYPEGEAWDQFHRVAGTAQWVNGAGLLSGPAPGFVGKWYYLFGYLGLVIGGVFTGILFKALGVYPTRYAGTSGLLVAISLCMFGFGEMNNPFGWVYGWLPSSGMGLFLTLLVVRRRRRLRNRLRPARFATHRLGCGGESAFTPLTAPTAATVGIAGRA